MTPESTEIDTELYEQIEARVETVTEELAEIERLSEQAQNPALERNAAHLQSVVQTLEINLPSR